MKIRVAVNVTVNKKDPRYCGNCRGLGDYIDTGIVRCEIFGGRLVDEYEMTNDKVKVRRCRACIVNQIPLKGVKKCR